MLTHENWKQMVNDVLAGRSDEEKIKRLTNMLDHAINHPWVDDDLRDSMLSNIAKEYGIPYRSFEDDEK